MQLIRAAGVQTQSFKASTYLAHTSDCGLPFLTSGYGA
mgnify:CR=1 FL=1|jgi:hypothetical protein